MTYPRQYNPPAGGGGAPTPPSWVTIDSLHGATLQNSGIMTGFTLNTGTGEWDADRNGTSGANQDGWGDTVGYYDLAMADVDSAFTAADYDFWAWLHINSSPGSSTHVVGISLLETDGATAGIGIGFRDTATVSAGELTSPFYSARETVAGITDVMGYWSFVDDGCRFLLYTGIGGAWNYNRTFSQEVAYSSTSAANMVLRVSSGVGATPGAGSTKFVIKTGSAQRLPLPN